MPSICTQIRMNALPACRRQNWAAAAGARERGTRQSEHRSFSADRQRTFPAVRGGFGNRGIFEICISRVQTHCVKLKGHCCSSAIQASDKSGTRDTHNEERTHIKVIARTILPGASVKEQNVCGTIVTKYTADFDIQTVDGVQRDLNTPENRLLEMRDSDQTTLLNLSVVIQEKSEGVRVRQIPWQDGLRRQWYGDCRTL